VYLVSVNILNLKCLIMCYVRRERDGFTDDCKYEFVYLSLDLIRATIFEITGKDVGMY